jgi:hypothetical protein
LHKITPKTLHKQINMTLEHKKNIFISLGKFLSQFTEKENIRKEGVLSNALFFEKFQDLILLSQSHNGWYTPENVYFAIASWANALTQENLDQWLEPYKTSFDSAASFDSAQEGRSKTVGLILAGNIPLVGFHDFLSVLISGHKVLVKTSSNDQHLLPFLAKYLIAIAPELESYITLVEGKMENFDAVIATGSNNTARYFEYYFKDKPSIIRKSRNSVAVLDGSESKEQMIALGEDVFRYFGLGCRNVSKIFIPKDYNFDQFFNGMFPYQDVIKYEKYANNYDYNKAVFLMSNFNLLDNEFLIIKEDSSYASPISSVFYEYYEGLDEIKARLVNDKEQIQCVVSNDLIEKSIAFGATQAPNLWDYADDVDTIDFLLKL